MNQSAAPLFAIIAVVFFLPGCADFWRVKRPVTAASGDRPRVEPQPDRPAPLPATPREPLPPKPRPLPDTTPRPIASPVPGKDGLVFSPYNNKVIDVKGFAPGTLVADPTFPMSERKFFRVP